MNLPRLSQRRLGRDCYEMSEAKVVSPDSDFLFYPREALFSAGLLPEQGTPTRQPKVVNLIDFTACNPSSRADVSARRHRAAPEAACRALEGRASRELRSSTFHHWRLAAVGAAAGAGVVAALDAERAVEEATSEPSAPTTSIRAVVRPGRPSWVDAASVGQRLSMVVWHGMLAAWTAAAVVIGGPVFACASAPFWIVGLRVLGRPSQSLPRAADDLRAAAAAGGKGHRRAISGSKPLHPLCDGGLGGDHASSEAGSHV